MSAKTNPIRLVFPSSSAPTLLIAKRIDELRQAGVRLVYDEIRTSSSWPMTSGSIEERLQQLTDALLAKDVRFIWCGRGGYGASDLLPHLPWGKLRKQAAKIIVGFSDATALQTAFYTRLGWKSVHAPMPATDKWTPSRPDCAATLNILQGKPAKGSLSLQAVSSTKKNISGPLLGGCLSVLTGLIGTPYLPKQLKGCILFFEDVGENPGRIMRYLNQWEQAKLLKDVRAIVFGQLEDTGPTLKQSEILQEIAERFEIPLYSSDQFGHGTPNYPIGIGCRGSIKDNILTWNLKGPA